MLHGMFLAFVLSTGDSGLDSLNARLDETMLHAAQLESQHAAVSDILLAIHENLLVTREYYSRLQDEEARLLEIIEGIDSRCTVEESRRTVLSQSVSAYLVYVYSHRSMLGSEALFCRGGLSRVLRRETYLEFLARRVASEESELRTTTDSLFRYGDSLRLASSEIASLQRQMEDIQDRIVIEEGRQVMLRLQLGSELARARDSSSTIEAERQRVSSLVNDLRTASTAVSSTLHLGQPSADSRIGNASGSLSWPAEGDVVRHFGLEVHPVYGTETTCDGISVATAPSCGVRVVADGRILYARDFLSMGRLVVVDHLDGFYTVYGNLGSVEVDPGELVTEGDELGISGSLSDGTAGYYFEIRAGGQPVDPEEYLQ